MPGLRSFTVARCPLTVISVNCVIAKVFVTLSSLTVIDCGVTLPIVVAWTSGGFAFGFRGAAVTQIVADKSTVPASARDRKRFLICTKPTLFLIHRNLWK